jgi:hypothetical protein
VEKFLKFLNTVIPYEIWLVLIGINFVLILFGIFIKDYSLVTLGLLSSTCCAVSAYSNKKTKEDENEK